MPRVVRYNVAASLDGFIAGPNGEFDWIPEDPTVDFEGLFRNVDTFLMGRHTYEVARAQTQQAWGPGQRVFVFSSTLRPEDHPGVTIVRDDAASFVKTLRDEPGAGEIWLFGGGALFGSLLKAGQVDRVEVTVCPILLGDGIPLLPRDVPRTTMRLVWSQVYPSGMMALHYALGAR